MFSHQIFRLGSSRLAAGTALRGQFGRNFSKPFIKPQSIRYYATYRRFNNSKPEFDIRTLLRNRYLGYFVAGSIAFYVYNLDAAPFTGRHRFLWIPYWLETKIGDYSYSQLLGQYQNRIVPQSDPHYAQISRIMNRLLASAIDGTKDPRQVAHLKSLNWTIHIINAPDAAREPPNAFILPNGKIFIFSSILPICKNEDGLATVLSHELSHQLAHHSLEQLSAQPIYMILSTLLYASTGISGFGDLLVTGLFQMPSSREMELEADHIGCELMARLCFNFREAVNFWGRMEQFEERLRKSQYALPNNMMMDFFSTHPNTKKRIQDIQLWIPELNTIQESSDCHQFSLFQDFSRNFFGTLR
ncbi:hypothetical protein PUMCH_003397 [Australozyma saopauloensis]|uniref:Peptidase M48 domain-containing protein n=1 Tax=Australozyma saopauloensis TaxID=291208 RepID=A0AAX4HDU6_9ASCO|nr:hypothetical protein PUMCH_003397 [[Candida] saopauloensis]